VSQQANHVFGVYAIFFAAEVGKCDRWLRCHAVIFAVALFLRTFYSITQFEKLQGCVDLNRDLRIKTKETGFLREYFVRATETRKNPVSDYPCVEDSAVETATIQTKSADAD
jgi:hypothetical protein